MQRLHQELPYALTVEIEEFSRTDKLLRIGAIIWVEREGQKQIVIGKGGNVLKQVGSGARQELQELLDKEMKVLQEERKKNRYTAEERIVKQEGIIKEDPKNAEAHFALGEAYDEMRAGANAIVHTQIAELLFKEQENTIGLAKSRRNLRRFFEKYDYKKEDFLLN